MNRYSTCKELRLLFPKLRKLEGKYKNITERMLTGLLGAKRLKPEEREERPDPGNAWTISKESYMEFSNEVHRKREEVRERLVQELKEQLARGLTEIVFALDEVRRAITELNGKIEKLQAEVEKEDKREKVKDIIKGY